MDVKLRDIRVDAIKTDLLVLPIPEKELEKSPLYALDRRVKGKLRERIEKSRFTGAEGSALLFPAAGALPASNLLLLGMGRSREIEIDTWRKAAARARKEASTIGAAEIAFYFNPATEADNAAGAVVEGMLLASYQFNKYRSNSKPPSDPEILTLFRPGLKRSAAMEKSIRTVEQTTPGVFLARDLINEPPSVTTATFLVAQAQRHCQGHGHSVEVWGKKKIESTHLAGLFAVNRGSLEEPRFIVIHYRPARKAKKKIALIGKGITFDSGGLSLKPAKSMETMKLDMSGGAAVIGAMSRLPHLGFDVVFMNDTPTTE